MADDLYEKGLALRRRVLGDAHVDRSLASTDAFSGDLQQIVTEIGWGAFWGRPGLPLREKSIITVTLLAALGRHHELRTHAKGALRNGISPDELRDILIHAIPYVGFPASIDAIRTVKEVVAEYQRNPGAD